jgi:hypothetical protein
MPPKHPRQTSAADSVSRKKTADLLRALREVQREIRMLKARMDAAYDGSRGPMLRRKKRA